MGFQASLADLLGIVADRSKTKTSLLHVQKAKRRALALQTPPCLRMTNPKVFIPLHKVVDVLVSGCTISRWQHSTFSLKAENTPRTIVLVNFLESREVSSGILRGLMYQSQNAIRSGDRPC